MLDAVLLNKTFFCALLLASYQTVEALEKRLRGHDLDRSPPFEDHWYVFLSIATQLKRAISHYYIISSIATQSFSSLEFFEKYPLENCFDNTNFCLTI